MVLFLAYTSLRWGEMQRSASTKSTSFGVVC
jgi:hypothetical protein